MSTRRKRGADDIAGFAEALDTSRLLRGAVCYRRYVAGTPARLSPLARELPAPVREGLEAWGVQSLYSHQAEALEAVRGGRDVVLVTPTASGKSLVYMAPTLEMCGADPTATAIYLFPYKALAQDQARAFESLSFGSGMRPEPRAAIYDGDTPAGTRKRIRSSPPSVLITNPDMLHMGILAHHREWARFFSRLRLVVVDELHVYRGIFGSHLHHVMARLRRICDHYGSHPRFVACSATIGNPGELAETLLGSAFEVVDRSGAPRSGRHFLFVNADDSSPYTLATRIMAESMEAGLRTIAFTKARKITELVHSWLSQSHPDLARKVSAYRAGYLPEERRKIEERLASGDLLGVVSTSALEHGIDIGGLDVCILVGYPGSITSSWQRIGRVGRSDRESLVVLVGMQDALDQFFMHHPSQFFERGFESAAADPDNPVIAAQHLVCAAAELPITAKDRDRYPDPVFSLVEELTASGALVADHREEAWYSLRRNPQRDVSLRSSGESYLIVEEPAGRAVGSVDGVRAFVECHEGAVYLHQGQQFEVLRLDRERRRIEVRRCDVNYYTQVLSEKETEILSIRAERAEPGYVVRLGDLRVTQEFKQYARRRIADQVRLSLHPLDLPPVVYETVGMWIEIPPPLAERMAEEGYHFMGSIHASEHAAIALFPLLAICDQGDLGGISYPRHPQVGGPAVFIYDGYPGGIGLARKGYERTGDLLSGTARQIRACPCENGCPSCIHSPRCGSGNHPLDKRGSLHVLEMLLSPAMGALPASPALIGPARQDTASKGTAPAGSGEVSAVAAKDDRAPEGPGRPPAPEAPGASPPPAGALDPLPPRRAPRRKSASPAAPASVAAGGPIESSPARRAPVSGPGESEPRGGDLPSPRQGEAPAASGGRVLVLDVETLRSAEEVGGWGKIRQMGLALAVVFDSATGEFTTYGEQEVDSLAVGLLSADLVVGFNIRRFDYEVLRAYTAADFGRVRTLDMLEEIHRRLGFRISLGHLAEATLGISKSADGLQSLQWVREGRLDLVEEYCRRDVEVTRDLYEYGRREGYVVYLDREKRPVRCLVPWGPAAGVERLDRSTGLR
jgi:DEAD/DEAH box helicase domain-containing protein